MNTFRKYSFGSKGAATAKINALGLDEEGNPTHNHAIVHLGNIVVTPAEIDEDGKCTFVACDSGYQVDVATGTCVLSTGGDDRYGGATTPSTTTPSTTTPSTTTP